MVPWQNRTKSKSADEASDDDSSQQAGGRRTEEGARPNPYERLLMRPLGNPVNHSYPFSSTVSVSTTPLSIPAQPYYHCQPRRSVWSKHGRAINSMHRPWKRPARDKGNDQSKQTGRGGPGAGENRENMIGTKRITRQTQLEILLTNPRNLLHLDLETFNIVGPSLDFPIMRALVWVWEALRWC